MQGFIDLREAIRKFPALPEGPGRDELNQVIFKAINKLTGLSGMTSAEWRNDFLKGRKKLTWGDFRSPDDVPEFNILQDDILEDAYVIGESAAGRLKAYLAEHFGESKEQEKETDELSPPPEPKMR